MCIRDRWTPLYSSSERWLCWLCGQILVGRVTSVCHNSAEKTMLRDHLAERWPSWWQWLDELHNVTEQNEECVWWCYRAGQGVLSSAVVSAGSVERPVVAVLWLAYLVETRWQMMAAAPAGLIWLVVSRNQGSGGCVDHAGVPSHLDGGVVSQHGTPNTHRWPCSRPVIAARIAGMT